MFKFYLGFGFNSYLFAAVRSIGRSVLDEKQASVSVLDGFMWGLWSTE